MLYVRFRLEQSKQEREERVDVRIRTRRWRGVGDRFEDLSVEIAGLVSGVEIGKTNGLEKIGTHVVENDADQRQGEIQQQVESVGRPQLP
jgi:hypothetical protein